MSSIKLGADSGGGTVALKGPASTTGNANVELKLPVADGSANQVLATNGSGQLQWATDSTNTNASNLSSGTLPDARFPATLPAVSGANLTGIASGRINRNIVVNGAMNIAQRGTSSTASGYKTIDRIKVDHYNLGQTCTISQRALTSADTGPFAKGFRNCLKIALAAADSAAANKGIQWGYRVEGQDICNSGWDYGSASSNLTVSFWIKVSAAQTFYLMMEGYSTGTNRYYVKPFTPSGTSWERITLTIPGDASTTGFNNDNAVGINFWIMPYYGTDYTATGTINSWHDGNASTSMPDMASTWLTTGTPVFELTGYQIEAGDSATEFEHRSYGDELFRCMRYYQQHVRCGASNAKSASQVDFNPILYPDMRAAPTIGQTGVISMNGDNADKTQGSTGLNVYGSDTTSAYVRLENFSSLTAWRAYLMKFGNTNALTYSAEL